jgi:hypothetical protein
MCLCFLFFGYERLSFLLYVHHACIKLLRTSLLRLIQVLACYHGAQFARQTAEQFVWSQQTSEQTANHIGPSLSLELPKKPTQMGRSALCGT